jgi:leucyl aminopeptidase
MVELIVSSQAVEEQTCGLVAVSFFQDDRQLQSEARRIDQRMGGMITSRLNEGFMTGELGEATLIPAVGRVRADKVLYVGLGERKAFCYKRVRELAKRVVMACIGLQIYDLLLSLPDPLVFGLDWTRFVEAMTEGIGLGLETGGPNQDIRVRLSRGADFYDQILRGVESGRRVVKNPFHVRVFRETPP